MQHLSIGSPAIVANSRKIRSGSCAVPGVKPFRADLPVAFVYSNLVRLLVLEAKAYQLKKGDGVDFVTP